MSAQIRLEERWIPNCSHQKSDVGGFPLSHSIYLFKTQHYQRMQSHDPDGLPYYCSCYVTKSQNYDLRWLHSMISIQQGNLKTAF